MDSITQLLLGGAVGGAVLGRRLGRKAVIGGAVLGTLPDLDVLIDYGDAVADYTYHRGFSHSLFVLAGLAALLATLAARLARWRGGHSAAISPGHWWLFFTLCLLTHPLLDAFTTYGTQLWWPLATPPVSWASIFIIDPLYTLPLLVATLFGLIGGRVVTASRLGLALSCAYLAFGLGAKTLMDHRLAPVLAERGLDAAPRLIQPTPFNTLLWRATIVDGEAYHETLIGLLDDAPPRLETFRRGATLEDAAQTTAAGARLTWFAGPYLRYASRELGGETTLVATDLRLGFPGYHPFSFTLARREGNDWQPVASQQLDAGSRGTQEALGQLARRALNQAPLCLGDHVAKRLTVEARSC
ncbi:metal-dependent hydrolase [Halomonas sp. YLGW01]|uniref:metal-dependent hydrolase n=1 Tax=Halomonas sp. YLGW01 TaxID=2773308 RepID=UPI0017869ED7|nr:metal-dependent hydrolase [Halomonas sp. YLGW01]